MIDVGLTHKQKLAFHDLVLGGHHSIRIQVETTALDGTPDADLSGFFLDGQVDFDGTADVTRSCSLTLIDPHNSLDFDADSPGDAALFLDRMIRVHYGVKIDFQDGQGNQWIDVPVFTGPISSLSRTGATVNVEAQGKEVLASGAVWKPLTIPAKTRKTTAIRTILKERAGEDRFHMPDLPHVLPKPLTLPRSASPWINARHLAQSLHRQLFYNGRGVVVLRRHPDVAAMEFGPGCMLSELEVSYDQGNVINAVYVKGGVPKGKKDQVTAQVFARRYHPLSPARLGRNGVPRYLMEIVQDEHATTQAAVLEVAKHHLQRGLLQAIDATVDVMPFPLLEPGDLVRAITDAGAVTFRANTFSLPLSPGQPMSIGYLKNVSPKRRHGKTSLRYRARYKNVRVPELYQQARQARHAYQHLVSQVAKEKDVSRARARQIIHHRRHAAWVKSHEHHGGG
jgi:hypothetical protein